MHVIHTSSIAASLLSLCFPIAARPISLRGSSQNQTLDYWSQPGSVATPSLDENFPDPSFITLEDGIYAFATGGQGKHIQMAVSPSFSNPAWTMLDIDPLPNPGDWTENAIGVDRDNDIWAPTVMRTSTGSFVMYYAAPPSEDNTKKCIGTATADSITGPYTPSPDPFACPLDQGGAIDPTIFPDPVSGNTYIAYKIDGNSLGPGTPTPIMLQQISDEDGLTPLSEAVQIYTQNPDGSDGPLVEAPTLVYNDGIYFLLFSTHLYNTPQYDVRYTTSTSLTGPYDLYQSDLLSTYDGWDVVGPGSIDVHNGQIAFHGALAFEPLKRALYTGFVEIDGDKMSVTALA